VRIDGLGRVFERVQRKIFPVLDHGLVLEQLVDVFAEQLSARPFCQFTKLWCDETYLARSSPDDCRGPAERDQLVEFLQVCVAMSYSGLKKEATNEKRSLKALFHKHFVVYQ